MDDDDRTRSHLFTVRIWREGDVAADVRGSVRDVLGGETRGFRSWSDLVDFMTDRLGAGQGETR
jgi:hypothetical protein